nr:hypothetical protein [Tanacetum cinerariifolium]
VLELADRTISKPTGVAENVFVKVGESDSEEIENFLNDDPIPIGVEDSPFNMDEDILFLEGLLIEDPSPPHPIISKSSTKNLVPIPRESEVTSDDGSESIEPVKDDSLVLTTISNPLFDDDKINSNELNSHVEPNSDESTSNHDTVKIDHLDEFSGPLIPIHIVEEERIRMEHAKYINRMEMLFTINPRPHPLTTDDVLPPCIENDDSDEEEVDVVGDLRVDNSIQNSKHDFSKSEDSDFDNPSLPLPPPEPPDDEFDFKNVFGDEISVMRNMIVKFECIDARVKFDIFNDENGDLSYFVFAKVFSLLSAESDDTIFDPGFTPVIEVFLCWIFVPVSKIFTFFDLKLV